MVQALDEQRVEAANKRAQQARDFYILEDNGVHEIEEREVEDLSSQPSQVQDNNMFMDKVLTQDYTPQNHFEVD